MSGNESNNPQEATVMGTGDAVGLQGNEISASKTGKKKWLIARVLPNTEKASCKKLELFNHECFAATQEEVVLWKNGERKKRKKIQRVVITQYIFVHATDKEREQILSYQFIRGYLLNRATSADLRTYAELTDTEVARLKDLTNQSLFPVKFAPGSFKMGEEVTLQLGTFTYTANIFRIIGEKSPCIGVRVKELGCAYIEVPIQALTKPPTTT